MAGSTRGTAPHDFVAVIAVAVLSALLAACGTLGADAGHQSAPSVSLTSDTITYTYNAHLNARQPLTGLVFGLDVLDIGRQRLLVTRIAPVTSFGHPVLVRTFLVPFGGNVGAWDAAHMAKAVPPAQLALAAGVGDDVYPVPVTRRTWARYGAGNEWQLVIVLKAASPVTTPTGITGFDVTVSSGGRSTTVRTHDTACFVAAAGPIASCVRH